MHRGRFGVDHPVQKRWRPSAVQDAERNAAQEIWSERETASAPKRCERESQVLAGKQISLLELQSERFQAHRLLVVQELGAESEEI
jgi:hypothetical protein